MTFDISVLVDIALILIGAKIFGEIAERLKFPSLFGQLIGGLLMGAFAIVRPSEFMNELATIGILFMFFMLGITMKVSDIIKDIRPTFLVTIGGTFISFIIGFLFGYSLYSDVAKGIFVGVAVMSTSTAIALKVLHDAGELNTKLFNLASAVSRVDDVIAILAITMLTSLIVVGPQLNMIILAFVVVLAVFLVLEKWAAGIIGRHLEVIKQLRDENILIALAIVLVFVVAYFGQVIGIGSAIGAFLAGYALSKSRLTESDIIPKMRTIADGFFIPIFFTYAAIIADPVMIYNSLGPVIALFILAIIAKFVGTMFFAWWEGYRGKDLGILGAAMIPRGEYAIAVAFIAFISMFVEKQLYSIIVAFIMLTIFITPIAFRIFKKRGF